MAATVQQALVVADVPGAGGVLHMMGNQDERRGGRIVERVSWNWLRMFLGKGHPAEESLLEGFGGSVRRKALDGADLLQGRFKESMRGS